MNHTFFKILVLDQFLEDNANNRKILLDELKNNACDPVIRMRRIRMLHQLAMYESEIIQKIDKFDSDDIDEWLDISQILDGVYSIINRSA